MVPPFLDELPENEWHDAIEKYRENYNPNEPLKGTERRALTPLQKCEVCGAWILFAKLASGEIYCMEIRGVAIDSRYPVDSGMWLWTKDGVHHCVTRRPAVKAVPGIENV